MGTIFSLVVLTVVVAIHELGHLVAMRRNGVRVLQYAIGFGPVLLQRNIRGIDCSLRLIPLGGFVRPQVEGPDGIEAASGKAKFKIYMAGMFANALAAWAAFSVVYMVKGLPVSGLPALTQFHQSWPIICAILVAFAVSFGLWLGTPAIFVYMLVSNFTKTAAGVSGPVGIVQMGASIMDKPDATMSTMIVGALGFFALINVSVAGLNMLPIIPLDGGRVFDLIVPRFFGKYTALFRKVFYAVSIVLMLGLLILALSGDAFRLIKQLGN